MVSSFQCVPSQCFVPAAPVSLRAIIILLKNQKYFFFKKKYIMTVSNPVNMNINININITANINLWENTSQGAAIFSDVSSFLSLAS